MKAILFDLDGVFYEADRAVPGAAEAARAIAEWGVPHLFLTNTTSATRAELVAKLARHGVETSAERIITPLYAASRWLHAQGAEGVAPFVTPSALRELEALPLLPDDAEHGADYVVVGDMGDRWDYATVNRAFRLLMANPRARLVALGMSDYWHAPDGLRLDVAPFIALLERAAERRAIVLGKPAPTFFQVALDRLGVPARQVLMIGDDIRTDIGGAQALDMRAILVRTGKYRPGDLQRGIIPDAVLDSVADLPNWWEQYGQINA